MPLFFTITGWLITLVLGGYLLVFQPVFRIVYVMGTFFGSLFAGGTHQYALKAHPSSTLVGHGLPYLLAIPIGMWNILTIWFCQYAIRCGHHV